MYRRMHWLHNEEYLFLIMSINTEKKILTFLFILDINDFCIFNCIKCIAIKINV